MLNIISLTWSGRFSTKRIWLGSATVGAEDGAFFLSTGAAATCLSKWGEWPIRTTKGHLAAASRPRGVEPPPPSPPPH
jgi:hypothetical protein